MPIFDINDAPDVSGRKLIELKLEDIRPNPYQPRTTFNDESITELAESIKQVGLLQPLLVRRVEDGYELVAGERRLRAMESISMEKAPCIVQSEIVDETSAMMALIENLQREDLHFLEEARCYEKMLDAYSLTQEELAKRIGKSQSAVANKLRLLKLSDGVRESIVENELTERHARAIIRLKDEKHQLEAVKRVKEKNLSVKETEQYVEKTLNKLYDDKSDGAKPRPVIMRVVKDYRLFMNTVNMAVNDLRQAGMRVEIEQSDRDNGVDIFIRVSQD